MRIVLDAMGTDLRPVPDVSGGIEAARALDSTIIFVGDEQQIRRQLAKHHTQGLKLEVAQASEVITMEDKPGEVIKGKPDSSMHVGLRLVQDGRADAFVTAGNTGAALAVAMLATLHRIPAVKRPALTAIFPIYNRPLIFLDVGANTEAKAEWLAQFALMGHLYACKALDMERPRVGLLANGEEESKGTAITREASALIQQLPLHFVGNVEPKEVLRGEVDVVVTDGFTGNILIKTFEASTRYLAGVLRDELKRSVLSSVGALLARSAFTRARARMNTAEVGGAPLLGLNGVVIVAHGSADSLAIKNAVIQAHKAVRGKVVEAIEEGLTAAPGAKD